MICSRCKANIQLSHRPGIFLAVAGVSASAAAIAGFVCRSANGVGIAVVLGLIAVIALGGVITEMIDASKLVYSKSKRRGVQCDKCGHVTSIHPWSL